MRKEEKQGRKKSKLREWIDAIVFAAVAAILIRGLFIEAFTIPTSSMRYTQREGDYLFVSKIHFGPRMPVTPLAIPFTHQKFPLLGFKSYVEWIRLPYFRIPGFTKIKNNDIVVFNWPADPGRPVDQKTNYVKRCLAIPGDVLEIRKDQVYINGKPAVNPPGMQHLYMIRTNGVDINPRNLERMDVTEWGHTGVNEYRMMLTDENLEAVKNWRNVVKVTRDTMNAGLIRPEMFPHDPRFPYTLSTFGPFQVPEKGLSIKINADNLPLYKRVIEEYEENDVEVKGKEVIINGSKTDFYTFKMNYYWMMGDNRDNSQDSRFWGFVPENHVIGKAWFTFFSLDPHRKGLNKIRIERIFRPIR